MKLTIFSFSVSMAAAFVLPSVVFSDTSPAPTPTPVPVITPHDSNTLHQVGNSIQYVFRKAGKNVSNNTHKVANKKNVDKVSRAVQYPIQKAGQNISVDTHNVEGKKSTLHQTDGTDKTVPPLPHNKRKHLFQ